MLMIQTAHLRRTETTAAGDTGKMAPGRIAVAITSIAGRRFGSLLPAQFTTGFNAAATGTTAGLIGAITCRTFSWTGLIVVHT